MWKKMLKEMWTQVKPMLKQPLLFIGGSILAILLLIPIITFFIFSNDLKTKESIMNSNNTGLTLLDRNNKPFFTFNQAKNFTYEPLSSIPLSMQEAVIASEDRNFYTNPGISIKGIIRAFFVDILSRSIKEGGSTISQELIKNALLSPQQSFLRKYQEAVLAYDLNKRYSKHDILEMYLNSVYFGQGAFGIENAAKSYFGKSAKDLTLAQSSMLVGLLPAPSYLDPLTHGLSNAKKRQAIVLQNMVEQKYITHQQEEKTEKENLAFHPSQNAINTLAPHFALYVKSQLEKKYGEETILRSGFRVKTTLNSDWQAYAEKVVKNDVTALAPDHASNGAAVVIDPSTGEIEVMVGSVDWNNQFFGKTNMSISPRQPGSSFKPIIYADAFTKHLITAATLLHDVPTTFPGNYQPHDYDRKYRGLVTVRRALANSLNIPAVEVMQKVGVENGVDFARTFGITTLKDPSNYGLSLVLGAAEVPLVEMTDVYATFANKGKYNPPTSILEVKDKNNNVLQQSYSPSPTQVVSNDVSLLISSILSDNRTRAEEFGNLLTINRPAAVKTGTTNDFKDAWTLGYTPNLAVGVWVGNNNDTPMNNIAGSLGAAPIWKTLMEKFLSELPYETFQQPSSLIRKLVCPYAPAGTIATTSAYPELFLPGTEPEKTCTISTPVISISPTPSSPANSPTPSSNSTPTLTPKPTHKSAPTESGPTPTPATTPIQVGITIAQPFPLKNNKQ